MPMQNQISARFEAVSPDSSPLQTFRCCNRLSYMTWTNPTPNELAADWIACRGSVASDASNGLANFLLVDFPQEEPELTWDTIILVVKSYNDADFYDEAATEAQEVCGLLAAGPVEDLLSYHGRDFIDRFENEARLDRRMAWVLGGAWQFKMSDEIWKRVRLAADDTYWKRKIS